MLLNLVAVVLLISQTGVNSKIKYVSRFAQDLGYRSKKQFYSQQLWGTLSCLLEPAHSGVAISIYFYHHTVVLCSTGSSGLF